MKGNQSSRTSSSNPNLGPFEISNRHSRSNTDRNRIREIGRSHESPSIKLLRSPSSPSESRISSERHKPSRFFSSSASKSCSRKSRSSDFDRNDNRFREIGRSHESPLLRLRSPSLPSESRISSKRHKTSRFHSPSNLKTGAHARERFRNDSRSSSISESSADTVHEKILHAYT